MAEFRGIQTSLFLILMLQFTEAATRQHVTVRDGDEVTLPCNSVTEDQNNCDSTEWYFTYLRSTPAVALVRNGQIEEAKAESDRLSVSQNCSLVMKKVTRGDVGLYVCKQVRPGGQYEDAEVYLSVVSMTEETNRDEVTLRCSVWTYERCPRTVKWMNGGQDVDKDNEEVKTSQDSCFASLSFMTSHFFYTSSFTSLKCEVTDGDKVMQFSPSGDKTGDDLTTTKSTTTIRATSTRRIESAIPENKTSGDRRGALLRTFVVCLGSAALLISVVTVNIWTRTKGKETRMEEIMQMDEVVEGDDSVNYVNVGEPSASVSLD